MHNIFLNQKYPLIRYNHKAHLSEGQKEWNEPLRCGYIIEKNVAHIIENNEPLTYSKAVMSRNSNKWLETMKSEIDFMYTNQMWTLVDALEGVTPILCKWVYKRKIEEDGQIEIYKIRLVAKGSRQK